MSILHGPTKQEEKFRWVAIIQNRGGGGLRGRSTIKTIRSPIHCDGPLSAARTTRGSWFPISCATCAIRSRTPCSTSWGAGAADSGGTGTADGGGTGTADSCGARVRGGGGGGAEGSGEAGLVRDCGPRNKEAASRGCDDVAGPRDEEAASGGGPEVHKAVDGRSSGRTTT